jgi:hypothetical protein
MVEGECRSDVAERIIGGDNVARICALIRVGEQVLVRRLVATISPSSELSGQV